jgi:hypothetical protein
MNFDCGDKAVARTNDGLGAATVRRSVVAGLTRIESGEQANDFKCPTTLLNAALPALVLMTGLTLTACGHPSDASMEKRFATHESDFEQLLEMSKADSQVARIKAEARDQGPGRPGKVLTEQRWQAYRSLFQETGLNGGIDRSQIYPAATFFVASYSGIGIKGYVYSDAPLSPLVASLEGKLPPEVGSTGHGIFAFKHIKANWYLYYYE